MQTFRIILFHSLVSSQICNTCNGIRAIGAIAGGVAVGAVLLFAVPVIALVYCNRRKPPDDYFDVAAEEDPEVNLGQLKKFSLRELHMATDNFNIKNIIGKGGFGKVYKGRLTNGDLVAVKKHNQDRPQSEDKQFQTEVEMISMAVHRNLLRLIGFCMTTTDRLLLYPLMVNGSVDSRFRGENTSERQEVEDTGGCRFGACFNTRLLEGNYDEEEIQEVIQVALLCTQSSPSERPTMSEVVRMLEGEGLAEKWDQWGKKEDMIQQNFNPFNLYTSYDSTSNI